MNSHYGARKMDEDVHEEKVIISSFSEFVSFVYKKICSGLFTFIFSVFFLFIILLISLSIAEIDSRNSRVVQLNERILLFGNKVLDGKFDPDNLASAEVISDTRNSVMELDVIHRLNNYRLMPVGSCSLR
jgi:hypothetical protein